MNLELTQDSIAGKLSAWWNSRREAAKQMNEIRSLGYGDLEEVAADCGVSVTQLVDLVRAGPHATDEMLEMMKALNIDPASVQSADPHLYHDMQIACAECGSKKTCRKHFKDGTAPSTYNDYCVNAEMMSELRADPEMLAG